jgi:hypothetical protein
MRCGRAQGLAVGVKSRGRLAIADVSQICILAPRETSVPMQKGEHSSQRGAFTGSRVISASSLEKLKSVGALPVINRAPRLNVRSCIAH